MMKQLLSILLFLLGTLEAFTQVSPSNLTFSSPSTVSQTVSVSGISNHTDWDIYNVSGDWVSLVTPGVAGGTGPGNITVSMRSNSLGINPSLTSSRQCVITIMFAGGVTKTVTITQEPTPAMITFDPASITISQTIAGHYVTLTSDADWSGTTTSTDDWLRFDATGGGTTFLTGTAGSMQLGFYADNNTSGIQRTGTITITSGVTTVTLTVTQLGNSGYLTVADDELEYEWDYTTVYYPVQVTSNQTWTATIDASWVNISNTQISYTGDYELLIGVTEENTGTTDRTATITLTDGTNTQTINIIQKAESENNPPTNITDGIKETKIDIYPNPFAGVLNIDSKIPVAIQIYNTTGKLIYSVPSSLAHKIELNQGVYFLELSDNTGSVIKQKVISE